MPVTNKTIADATWLTIPDVVPFDPATGAYLTPDITYADATPGTNIGRYQQVTGTIADSAGAMTLTAAATAFCRERLSSYKFGSGGRIKSITLPASGTNGDYFNVKFGAPSGDLLTGYGLGVIRTAGAWNICTVKNTTVTDTGIVVTGLADGDTVYLDVEWDVSRGVYYGYVYESVKPAAQVTIYDATYQYGYTGVVFYNAGASAKTITLNSVSIRARCLVGETNIPATETGFYFRDEFTVNDGGRWTDTDATHWTWDTANSRIIILTSDLTSSFSTQVPFKVTSESISYVQTNENVTKHFKYTVNFGVTQSVTTNPTMAGFPGSCIFFDSGSGIGLLGYINKGGSVVEQYSTVNMSTWKTSTNYIKIVPDRVGGTIKIYRDTTPNPTTLIATFTHASISSISPGVVGIGYKGTTGYSDTYISQFTISGTRYYMKPMLRGASQGEYWTGTAVVKATRYSDDFNYDTHLEYSGDVASFTWDTVNGNLQATASPKQITLNSLRFSDVEIQEVITPTGTADHTRNLIIVRSTTQDSGDPTATGNKYYFQIDTYGTTNHLRCYKVVAGTATILGSPVTVFVFTANTQYKFKVSAIGNVLSASVTQIGTDYPQTPQYSIIDSTFTSGYVGVSSYYDGANRIKIDSITINALESTSTNGAAIGIGGIAHGGIFDVENWMGLRFTKDVFAYARDYACTAKYGLSTIAGEAFSFFFKNATDDTAILASGAATPKQEDTTTGLTYTTFNTPDLRFTVAEDGREIFIGISKTITGTTPMIYLTDLNLTFIPQPLSSHSDCSTDLYARLRLDQICKTISNVATDLYARLRLDQLMGTHSDTETDLYARLRLDQLMGTHSDTETDLYARLQLAQIFHSYSDSTTDEYADLWLPPASQVDIAALSRSVLLAEIPREVIIAALKRNVTLGAHP